MVNIRQRSEQIIAFDSIYSPSDLSAQGESLVQREYEATVAHIKKKSSAKHNDCYKRSVRMILPSEEWREADVYRTCKQTHKFRPTQTHVYAFAIPTLKVCMNGKHTFTISLVITDKQCIQLDTQS